ncbi:MAG: TonB-dependent receptor [Planctomycetota bacterium]
MTLRLVPARLLAALPLALVSDLCAQDPTEPPAPTQSQNPPEAPHQAKPVIVTAARLPEDPFDVPYAAQSVTEADVRRRAYRTVPQALRDVPGVMVQETAHGHGSPYIRGFTSFRNLFLIDGVRLNNSVFRPGPNQYWNSVDPLSIERLEIVKGPSSVLYGSDAVGGTVQAITKSPTAFAAEGAAYGGAAYLRYSTAEDSIQGRGEFSLGYTWSNGQRTGILLGGNAKSFGDLEGGADVGTQFDTGYDETDFDVKVDHWLDEDTRLTLLHQRVTQNDVPRTHRTVNGITWRGLAQGSDLRRSFDQERRLTYLQLHRENSGGAIDAVRANVSWQEQDETRDRIRGNGNQEFTGFEVGTLGAWLQLESPTPLGRLAYGVEYYRDHVDSFFRRAQNPTPADAIQGPIADDATYDLLGVYLQDQIDVHETVQVTLGGRFNYAAADADSVRDPVSSTRISLDDDWTSFVGSARVRWTVVPDQVNVFGGVSQGFRAPNLSDLSRFDTARSGEFEIPAPGLDPEHYITYEIGTRVATDDVSVLASYFYTDIEDQILRFPTGATNPSGESEVTKANVGDGQVYGVELGTAVRVVDDWTVFGNATFVEGRVSNFDGTTPQLRETYLTRLMPFTAQIGARWEEATGRWWVETVLQHAEAADRLSFGDQRDSSRIPPGGTPGYTVWHLRGGWQVTETASVDVLLENITDVDYRIHGSGLNRPGRNLIVGVTTRF